MIKGHETLDAPKEAVTPFFYLLPSPTFSSPCYTILPQSLTSEASQQHHQPRSRQPAAGRLLLSSLTAASSR